MQPIKRLAACILCSVSLGACHKEAVSSRVMVAQVGPAILFEDALSQELRRARIIGVVGDEPEILPGGDTRAHRQALIEDFITTQLLLAAAKNAFVTVSDEAVEVSVRKLTERLGEDELQKYLIAADLTTREFKERVRERLVVRTYVQDFVSARIAVDDAQLTSFLASHGALEDLAPRMHLRQILVKTAREAREIALLIKRGLPFAEAATKRSLAPEAVRGGDLGWVARGELLAPLEQVAQALPLRTLGGPVQTDWGWHLLWVSERSVVGSKDHALARQRAMRVLRAEGEAKALDEHLAALRRSAQIRQAGSLARGTKVR